MKTCTYCGNENTDESLSCGGCGTELAMNSNNAQAFQSQAPDAPRRAQAQKRMLNGAIWFFGGIAVTVITYLTAVSSPGGGHYVIAWGAIVFGAVRFFRGLAASNGSFDRSSQAQELLEMAARLEGVDRAKAIELYGEIARVFPDTSASKEAQRNIQTLLSHSAGLQRNRCLSEA